MPVLIAHAELEENAKRIDADIPEEYRNLDAYMVVCKWKGTGTSQNYPCPNINMGTDKAYPASYSSNTNVTNIFYCTKNMSRTSGYTLGVTNTADVHKAGPISKLGIMQYYDTNNFLDGSTVDVYAINTEVST